MEDLNFSEKNIENTDEEMILEKTTKILLSYDQLDYIRFRLKFMDGFNFGLGLIFASILFSSILVLILILLGFSFSNFILKSLM